MGERASIAYVETAFGKDERVFFYGHWIADGSIDALVEALNRAGNDSLPAKIARAMDNATDGSYDITPYMIMGNYPTLYVRNLSGTPEVALADSESPVHSADLLWIEADDFISFAERSSGLSYSDRFAFINALILGY